jgi:hypothetical protein
MQQRFGGLSDFYGQITKERVSLADFPVDGLASLLQDM